MQNTNVYKSNHKPRPCTLQTKANELIQNWVVENRINADLGKGMKTHNGITSKMYGLIKTHKNNSIRPILSCTGSPLYKISKFGTWTCESSI